MRKSRLVVLLMTGFLLTAFLWYLKSSLWLERLMAYGFSAPQGKNWQNETEKFRLLYPAGNMQLIFLGDSHMEQCEWQEVLPEYRCANRGIGGETTAGLLQRLLTLPEKGNGRVVILQSGINDLFAGESPEEIIKNYGLICDSLRGRGFRLMLTLVFPVRYLKEVNEQVPVLNKGIRTLAEERKLPVIFINPRISEGEKLSSAFTADGVHLNARGYALWLEEIRKKLPPASDAGFR